MVYFPNSMSMLDWQEEHCTDCLNYRDNGTGSHGCPITDVHFILDYHEGTNAAALDSLIPAMGAEMHKCRMRLTREDMDAADLAQREARDRKRYLLAMMEQRA